MKTSESWIEGFRKAMSRGAVTRIIDFSPVDGPGNRMVVFLQGCNFNCWYCHNPETIPLAWSSDSDPLNPSEFVEMTAEDIVNRYRKAAPFISGVTFSGGECSVQFQFLIEACEALKTQGAHVLIDTNGHLNEEMLQRLLTVTDGIMIDIKAIGPKVHKALTGADNERVLNSFHKALASGKLAEVRTVIRGGESDALDTVAWVARELAMVDPKVLYRIIRYRVHGVRKEMIPLLKPPTDAFMEECRRIAETAGMKHIIMV